MEVKAFGKIILLMVLVSQPVFSAGKTTPVVFIGSELLSKNNLPEVVKFLVENATQKHIEIDIYPCMFSGFRMQWMDTFDNYMMRVVTGKYKGISNRKKIAILQERPEMLLGSHIKTTQPLDSAIMSFTQDKTDPYILSSTPYIFCPYLPKDKADQQEIVNEKLQKLAEERKVAVIPVAQIWREVEAKNDRIYLYHANDAFPSQHGTYLTACAILEVVFKTSCLGLPTSFEVPDLPTPIKYQLNPSHCQIIQSTTHEYVQNFKTKNP